MKKIMLSLLLPLLAGGALTAQVAIGVKLPEITLLNEQAQLAITKKLQQLTTLNGVGSNDAEACFVLVPYVSIVQSEVAPTAPPQQLVKLSTVLMVAGTEGQKSIVAQTEVASTGVGRSEEAAILNAVQQIDVRSPALKRFMEQAKSKTGEMPPCGALAAEAAAKAAAEAEAAAEAAAKAAEAEAAAEANRQAIRQSRVEAVRQARAEAAETNKTDEAGETGEPAEQQPAGEEK